MIILSVMAVTVIMIVKVCCTGESFSGGIMIFMSVMTVTIIMIVKMEDLLKFWIFSSWSSWVWWLSLWVWLRRLLNLFQRRHHAHHWVWRLLLWWWWLWRSAAVLDKGLHGVSEIANNTGGLSRIPRELFFDTAFENLLAQLAEQFVNVIVIISVMMMSLLGMMTDWEGVLQCKIFSNSVIMVIVSVMTVTVIMIVEVCYSVECWIFSKGGITLIVSVMTIIEIVKYNRCTVLNRSEWCIVSDVIINVMTVTMIMIVQVGVGAQCCLFPS